MHTLKKLPVEVTYLDILKTVAIILMIIDHIGYYFFPENDWFRAIGRACVPVWFFLIGYANTRELPNRLLIAALILALADLILFQRVFSLNILVSFIFLRLTLDYIMLYLLRSRYIYVLGFILTSLFFYGTNMVIEYGTLGITLAALGYITRHKNKIMADTFFKQSDYIGTIILTFIIFCILQASVFGFSNSHFTVMFCLTAFSMASLLMIRPMTFPQIKNKAVIRCLHLCGRNSLDIYVAHLVIFKLIIFTIYTLK